MALKETIIQLFDVHPTVQAFYITCDEMPFIHKPDAELHAESLKNADILEVKRNELPVLDIILKARNEGPIKPVATKPTKPAAKPMDEQPAQELTKTAKKKANKK